MAFVPFESITYETKLGFNEIIKRIQEIMGPRRFFRLLKSKSDKTYEGAIKDNCFVLNREVMFTNLFAPVMTGEIIKEDNKTKIDVKFRLHLLVRIVMLIWLVTVAVILFNDIIKIITNNGASQNLFTVALALVVGYAAMTGAFKTESKKDKEYLVELFEVKTKE